MHRRSKEPTLCLDVSCSHEIAQRDELPPSCDADLRMICWIQHELQGALQRLMESGAIAQSSVKYL